MGVRRSKTALTLGWKDIQPSDLDKRHAKKWKVNPKCKYVKWVKYVEQEKRINGDV